MPACPLSTLRRHSRERPTHDSGSWLVAIHYHVGDLHPLPFADFYRRFQPEPTDLFSLRNAVRMAADPWWISGQKR